MTTPPPKRYIYLHPCPICGKMKREKGSNCRECHLKLGKHITRGPKAGNYLNHKGQKRPLYRCLECGKEKKSDGGRCRECSEKAQRATRTPIPPCRVCKKRLSISRRQDICRSCRKRQQRADARECPLEICKDCGAKNDNNGSMPRCRACHGKMMEEILWQKAGGLPLDRQVDDAAKLTEEIKRCSKCGCKYTTQDCVRCVVLGKIGDKGFV